MAVFWFKYWIMQTIYGYRIGNKFFLFYSHTPYFIELFLFFQQLYSNLYPKTVILKPRINTLPAAPYDHPAEISLHYT